MDEGAYISLERAVWQFDGVPIGGARIAGGAGGLLGQFPLDPTAVGLLRRRGAEPMLGLTQLSHYLTLKGSFSAVSKPNLNEILQVNMRWKALAEIYKMHSFALL